MATDPRQFFHDLEVLHSLNQEAVVTQAQQLIARYPTAELRRKH